ncbi:hypothetical protein [Butyrivibrio sp. WCD2001]|uniref:hypothetical protein n=1 Tax=Butyrivibrio sp. WCD2001 TaxID=1280681 RepID=UPI0018CA5326|nr:hypothetical protein [Butyrivibrio sp. WCD2001]
MSENYLFEGKEYRHYITHKGIILGLDKHIDFEYPDALFGIRVINESDNVKNIMSKAFGKYHPISKMCAKWDKENWAKIDKCNGLYLRILLDAITAFSGDTIGQIATQLSETDFFSWANKKYNNKSFAAPYKAIYDDIDKSRNYAGTKVINSMRKLDEFYLICARYGFDISILRNGIGVYYSFEGQNEYIDFERIVNIFISSEERDIKAFYSKLNNVSQNKIKEIPVFIAQRDTIIDSAQEKALNDFLNILMEEAE